MSGNDDPNQAKTRAACYTLLLKSGKTYLIKRSNTGYRDGEWGIPAGKVDNNETFTFAAVREAHEEAGIIILPKDMNYVLTMHRKSDNAEEAWVDVLFVCSKWNGEPHNAEPEKHSEGKWFKLDNLPDDLMDYQAALINAYKLNKKYIEFGWEN